MKLAKHIVVDRYTKAIIESLKQAIANMQSCDADCCLVHMHDAFDLIDKLKKEQGKEAMKTDYQETGELYPKLDSYQVLKDPKGMIDYLGSSCQFKTKKKYKQWLLLIPEYEGLDIKIMKGE